MANFKLIKIGKCRPNGFGFKVLDREGKVVVTYTSPEGAAYTSGLRCGDILYSLNGDVVDFFANELPQKMIKIRGDLLLKVIRNSAEDGHRQSADDVNKGSGLISNSGSQQKLITSMSSVDLNWPRHNRHMLDVNYVPDEHIDQYLQPMTPNDTLSMFSYKSANDLDKFCSVVNLEEDVSDNRPSQVTRKQAYKKYPTDVGISEGPRFSVKKANKGTSFTMKEPGFVMKKRTNAKIGDVVATVSSQKLRFNTAPVVPSQQNLSTNNTHNNSSNQLSNLSNSNNNSVSSNLSLTPLSTSLNPPQCSTSDNDLPGDFAKSESVQVEAELKIMSFKEKVRKPAWKRFLIDNDPLGVLFQNLEGDDGNVACNSTAIDPLISGLNIYMRLWLSNNTTSRFFLPIGQQSFLQDINIALYLENIEIRYYTYDVHFLINYTRMTEDKCAILFNLLGVKLESPEPNLQTKKTRPFGNNDKNDFKKQKTPKYMSESPRTSALSNLPQTSLVENVPLVVIICVNIIEKLGIKMEGIYRKPGNESAKKKLENAIITEDFEKWSEYEEWSNINTVCSLLKSVLRTFSLIDKDTAIKLSMVNLSCTERSNQEQAYMDMIYHLSQRLCKIETRTDVRERTSREIQCRRETFKYILKHLDRVSQCHMFNQMSAENLATCFSPTIIEDIPCDEDGEYHTSKKSEADKNLKQMLTFWIKYSGFLDKLLDEEDYHKRLEKLEVFSETNYIPSIEETTEEMEDTEVSARKIIEHYTSIAFVPIPESDSLPNVATTTTPEVNNFSKLKNLGAYRSYKQPKTDGLTRKSSLSPQEIRRKDSGTELVADAASKSLSPFMQIKMDNWNSKSLRMKKKGIDGYSIKKELSLISMRISGLTEDVPLVVDVCITIIESYGLDLDGVYRVSGKKQDINCLEGLVVSNNDLGWYNDPYLSMWSNLYVVSCLLKSILKQFCLIKKETWVHMFSQFSEKMGTDELRKVLMESAYHLRHKKKKTKNDVMTNECENDIRSATLRYVLHHLKEVSRHVHNNRMTSNSLAVCFVPVLMEEDETSTADIVANNNKGIQILEKLIDHCDWIFQWDDRPWEDMYGKVMTDSLDSYLRSYSKYDNYIYKMEDNVTAENVVNTGFMQELLERFITKSQSRYTLRRYSDVSESSQKKSDYVDHSTLDDFCLENFVKPNTINNNCSRSLQNTDFLQ